VEKREQEAHGDWQDWQRLLLSCWYTPTGQEV
jgi:hypothetical protein